jgi:hypothetical protein
MRLTVIPGDNTVIIDGQGAQVDCSDLPSYVRAIQWDGAKGWIEHHPDANGRQHANVEIVSVAPYLYLVERWRTKIVEQKKEALTHEAESAESLVRYHENQAQQKQDFDRAAAEVQTLIRAQQKEKAEQNALLQRIVAENAELKARIEAAHAKIVEFEAKSNG